MAGSQQIVPNLSRAGATSSWHPHRPTFEEQRLRSRLRSSSWPRRPLFCSEEYNPGEWGCHWVAEGGAMHQVLASDARVHSECMWLPWAPPGAACQTVPHLLHDGLVGAVGHVHLILQLLARVISCRDRLSMVSMSAAQRVDCRRILHTRANPVC